MIPVLENLKQEALKASLGYIAIVCLRKTKTSWVCNPSYLKVKEKKAVNSRQSRQFCKTLSQKTVIKGPMNTHPACEVLGSVSNTDVAVKGLNSESNCVFSI